jgi:hypothetical protein
MQSMSSTGFGQRWDRVPAKSKGRVLGVSRSKLYELAHRHDGLFRKLDGVTLVDVWMLADIIAAAPNAKFPSSSAD